MVKFLEANALLALIYTFVFFLCPSCGSSVYAVHLCIPLWSILCSIWWHNCFWWYKKSLGLQLLHVQCSKNRSSTTSTQGSALHSFVIFILVPAASTEDMQWIHHCVMCTSITLFPVLWSVKWPLICTTLVSYTSLILDGIRTHSELRSAWKTVPLPQRLFLFSCYSISFLLQKYL